MSFLDIFTNYRDTTIADLQSDGIKLMKRLAIICALGVSKRITNKNIQTSVASL